MKDVIQIVVTIVVILVTSSIAYGVLSNKVDENRKSIATITEVEIPEMKNNMAKYQDGILLELKTITKGIGDLNVKMAVSEYQIKQLNETIKGNK